MLIASILLSQVKSERSYVAHSDSEYTTHEYEHAQYMMILYLAFWDMRLSIACAATDAEYQNRILLRDSTLNLPVVAQQPHPDPNHAAHTAVRLVVAA